MKKAALAVLVVVSAFCAVWPERILQLFERDGDLKDFQRYQGDYTLLSGPCTQGTAHLVFGYLNDLSFPGVASWGMNSLEINKGWTYGEFFTQVVEREHYDGKIFSYERRIRRWHNNILEIIPDPTPWGGILFKTIVKDEIDFSDFPKIVSKSNGQPSCIYMYVGPTKHKHW